LILLSQPTIDAISNPLILKNAHGVVLCCNDAFLRLRNCSSSKIIGYTAYDFLSQNEADYHTQADKKLLDASNRFIQYTYPQIGSFQEVLPPRDISKSIIHDPTDGLKQILVIIGECASKSAPLIEGLNLTQRENDVLKLLVQGHSQKRIAQYLMISHHTVADHCKSIYQKMGVNSRTEAQMIAISKLGISPHGLK
jgi:DNA-binding CsgD family transcriptional regulator